MKIGVIRAYYKNNELDFIIGYSKEHGFFKTKIIDNIPKDFIWFSNIEDEIYFNNIKNNSFFNFNEDKIFYYYGIINSSIKYKLKILYETYSNFIKTFNKKLNITFENLLKNNNIKYFLFKKNIYLDNFIDKNNNLNKDFSKKIFSKNNYILVNESKGNVYLNYPKYKFIKQIEDLFFPSGIIKNVNFLELLEESNKKNINILKYIKNKKYFYLKIKIKEIKKDFKIFTKYIENETYIININDINNIQKYINFEILEIFESEYKIRFKEILRKNLNLLDNNISVEIFSSNYLDFILNKEDNILNDLINSEKMNVLFLLLEKLIKEKIEIVSYGDLEIVLNVKEEDKIKVVNLAEEYDFIYPIYLLKN